MARNKREETIGERIQRLREENNETQAGLAAAVGESRRETIKHWENGTHKIKAESIINLAKHFNVSCDYILLGDEKKRSPNPDIDNAAETTGLSTDEIITIINWMKHPETAKGLRYLLNGCTFDAALTPISQAIEASEKWVEFEKKQDIKRHAPQEITQLADKLGMSVLPVDQHLYYLIEDAVIMFRNALEEIIDDANHNVDMYRAMRE